MTEDKMADEQKGLVSAGAGLVRRRQRILWWVFAVNFVLGALGTIPAVSDLLHGALGDSLAGEQLVKGFDIGMFFELLRLPRVGLLRSAPTSFISATLFALFMLFVSGGILTAYRQDRKLTTEEFFAASGAFFWRFVRLVLLSIIPFVVLGNLYLGVGKLSDYVADKTVSGHNGFYVRVLGTLIVVLLVLLVRLWFDVAKIRAVAQQERKMWRNLWRAFSITRRESGALLWMYFRISLVAWITLAVGCLIWLKLPPSAALAIFLLLEMVLLVQLGTRLWQLASAMTWYKRHAEMVPADSVDFTTPHPVEVVEPEAEPRLGLHPDAGLPPADV
jgi:hypothetical protein